MFLFATIFVKGKVNHVMSMFYSVGWEGINNHLNDVITQYYIDNLPSEEEEKINMPKTDFETIIGYRRPTKNDIEKCVQFVKMKLRKQNKEFLRLIVVEMSFIHVVCVNGSPSHVLSQHVLYAEIICVKNKLR